MKPYSPVYGKKTTSGKMLGMCYILSTTSSIIFYVASREQGGLGWGGALGSPSKGCRGGYPPYMRVQGQLPREKKFLRKRVTLFPHFLCRLDFHVYCWEVFRHMVFLQWFFVNGFLLLVKELRLLTNPNH
jgi:hypothetical protein